MSEALELEEAQTRLLALAPMLPTQIVPVEGGLGRYLAEDLRAARTQPAADLSAMDGYAVGGPGPWRLLGESRAGAPFGGIIGAGECVRIATGALLPEGADRIVIRERARDNAGLIETATLPPPGESVRRRGFDYAAGEVVLARGTPITPAVIALALNAGQGTVPVARAPRIAVVETGDELAVDPHSCARHQVPASNGAMIAAMLAPLGCEVLRIGPVPDDNGALTAALAQADGCDILVTSGGASVGDHDLVKPALAAWGAEIAFWRVAIRPGKPLLVATRGAQVVLGLPGNPASSFVTAFLFALPLVRAAMGAAQPLPRPEVLVTAQDLPPVGPRRAFLRAVSRGGEVALARSQDSGALASLAEADCLIDRPAYAPPLAAGSPVPVFRLRNG